MCIRDRLGLVNALLVNRLRVPSIIITISTLNIFYGLLLWLSKGVWLYDFPPWFEKGVMLFKYTDAEDVYKRQISSQNCARERGSTPVVGSSRISSCG